MSALDKQEGGGHYKGKAIQPVQYIHANGLGFCEGNVVKYITRWREKGGKADLLKVIHYVELLMELEGLADDPLKPTDPLELVGTPRAAEPAAEIDDPWYDAPGWAKYKAQDADGTWCWYNAEPTPMSNRWVCSAGHACTWSYDVKESNPNPNPSWRDTLISR